MGANDRSGPRAALPGRADAAGVRIRVWDLPTRIFHWSVVALVATSLITAELAGNWMSLHMRCGYLLLALVLFRLGWGFWGGEHARFRAFVRGPGAVWRYAGGLVRGGGDRYLGHNPMGGWSVLAMLTALGLQAGSGLFANDDIFVEGPLYEWVGYEVSSAITEFHEANAAVLGVLIGLHLAAIGFYLVIKRENLIGPMITGTKRWEAGGIDTANRIAPAVLTALAAAGIVYLLIR